MMTEESTIDQEEKSEKTEPEDVDEKPNPEEILTITKVPPKIHSRYLSARKSSCHDFCKYGVKHAVEEKPWRRGRETNVLEENVTSLAGTKKSGRSSKPSRASKGGDPSSPIEIKEVTNEKTVTSKKKSPPFEETDVSIEHHKSEIRQEGSEPSLQVQECSKSQTKREIVKNKIAFGSSSRKETERRSTQTKTEGRRKSAPPSVLSSPKQNVKKKPSSSTSAKTVRNLRGVSSLKTHENVEEVKHELASHDNLPDKILHVIELEPTSENLSEEPTKSGGETKLLSPSNPPSGEKISKRRTTKKIANSGVSSSSRKNLRHVAFSQTSSGHKGKINIVSASSKSPPVSSPASSSKSSLGKQNGATKSKSNKAGQGHQGENVKVGYKIRPKMSTKVVVGNKVVPPRKLTFRRGKVIEIQPQNNNIARRLKFKPARFLNDDMRREINGARIKRVITNKKVDDGGELNNAANASAESEKAVSKHLSVEGGSKKRSLVRDRSKNMYGSKSASEKVILRHQNVEGKKQNSGLYNNVIEETATMLAGLRKSKVKALVGAFETVISLDSPRAEANTSAAEVSTAC